MSGSGRYREVAAEDGVAEVRAALGRGRVVEVVGEGCTAALAGVRDAAPGAVWADATGRTAEDVLRCVLGELGVEVPSARRDRWRERARDAGTGGPILVVHAQRAGRTRSSAEAERVVGTLADQLRVHTRRDVVVAATPRDRWVLRRREALRLVGGTGAVRVPDDPRGALTALALAEPREVPPEVWAELVRASGGEASAAELAATAARLPELRVAEDGSVGFAEERVAEALRSRVDAEVARRTHARLVPWLRARLVPYAPGPGAAVAWYAAEGLAMHAACAGLFEEVQRDGAVVALLDQVALLDAARRAHRVIPAGTPAADAAQLWRSGVDSLDRREWASWLHLMATARGDADTAAAVERAVPELPWRVRWAHWRPPGGWEAAALRPGPLRSVVRVPTEGDRQVVAGLTDLDRRVWTWDAETGEWLAGPWPGGEVPEEGESEPFWPTDRDAELMPPWAELATYDRRGPQLLRQRVRFGELVVVCGTGGVFAVDVLDRTYPDGPSPVHGEALLADLGVPLSLPPDSWDEPNHTALVELFGAAAVHRPAPAELPAGLSDPTARTVLTEIGLPTFRAAELCLDPFTEGRLTEVTPDELRPGTPQPPSGAGPYYRLGLWAGDRIVLDGTTGAVLTAPRDAHDAHGQLEVAPDLGRFVARLQIWVLGRCLLPTASSVSERLDLRATVEEALDLPDDHDDQPLPWTAAFADL